MFVWLLHVHLLLVRNVYIINHGPKQNKALSRFMGEFNEIYFLHSGLLLHHCWLKTARRRGIWGQNFLNPHFPNPGTGGARVNWNIEFREFELNQGNILFQRIKLRRISHNIEQCISPPSNYTLHKKANYSSPHRGHQCIIIYIMRACLQQRLSLLLPQLTFQVITSQKYIYR